jgi:hypothetical protein
MRLSLSLFFTKSRVKGTSSLAAKISLINKRRNFSYLKIAQINSLIDGKIPTIESKNLKMGNFALLNRKNSANF